MTVAAKTPGVGYIENGVTLAFAVPFRYLDPTDLVVTRFVAGMPTVLAYGVAYSVTAGTTDAGGTLTLSASVAGATLRIRRATAQAQPDSYNTNDSFPAKTLERDLDRPILLAQESAVALTDLMARALKVPDGETASDLPAATVRANGLLGFGVAGAPSAVSYAALAALLGPYLASVVIRADATLAVTPQMLGWDGVSDGAAFLVPWATFCATYGLRGELRGPMRVNSAVTISNLSGLDLATTGAGELVFGAGASVNFSGCSDGRLSLAIRGALSSRQQFSQFKVGVTSAFAAGMTYTDGTNPVDGSDFTHTLSGDTLTLQLGVGIDVLGTPVTRTVTSSSIALDPTKRYVFEPLIGLMTGGGGLDPEILVFDASGNPFTPDIEGATAGIFDPRNTGKGYSATYLTGASSMKIRFGILRGLPSAVGSVATIDLTKLIIHQCVNDFATMGYNAIDPAHVIVASGARMKLDRMRSRLVAATAIQLLNCVGCVVSDFRGETTMQGCTVNGGSSNEIVDQRLDGRFETTGGALTFNRAFRTRASNSTDSTGLLVRSCVSIGYSWAREHLIYTATGWQVVEGCFDHAAYCAISATGPTSSTMFKDNVSLLAPGAYIGQEMPSAYLNNDGAQPILPAMSICQNPAIIWEDLSWRGVGIAISQAGRVRVIDGVVRAPITIQSTGGTGEVIVDRTRLEHGHNAFLNRAASMTLIDITAVRISGHLVYGVQGSTAYAIDVAFGAASTYAQKVLGGVIEPGNHGVMGVSNCTDITFSATISDNGALKQNLIGISAPAAVVSKTRFSNMRIVRSAQGAQTGTFRPVVQMNGVPFTGSSIDFGNVRLNEAWCGPPAGAYPRMMVTGCYCFAYPTVTAQSIPAGTRLTIPWAMTGASNPIPLAICRYGNNTLPALLALDAEVTADDTIALYINNPTAAAIAIPAMTFEVVGTKPN